MVPSAKAKKGSRAYDFLKNIISIFFNQKNCTSMNNYKPIRELFHRSLKRSFLIMRLAVVFLIIGNLQVRADETYSQKTRLSLSFSETELVRVLDKIEEESEFFFLYNEKLLDTNRKVSITAKNQLVNAVLDRLFSGTDVKYTIIDHREGGR